MASSACIRWRACLVPVLCSRRRLSCKSATTNVLHTYARRIVPPVFASRSGTRVGRRTGASAGAQHRAALAWRCDSLGPSDSNAVRGEMASSTVRSPTVFVIDDDVDVCAAIAGLLKSVGLRSETFGTAAGLPLAPGAGRAELSGSRHQTSWYERPRRSTPAGCRGRLDSHHLHHRSRRHPDDRPGDEIRCGGVSAQTVPRSGPAGCDTRRPGSRSGDACSSDTSSRNCNSAMKH